MANIKISDLPAASAALGTQQFEVNESGTSKRVTGDQIKTFAKAGLVVGDITNLTATASELNVLDGITATTAELNVLDGITATTTELNYTDGVTSNIQTQLNNRVSKTSSTGSAILPSGTTAQRDGSPAAGYIRFNSTDSSFEGYDGSAWGAIGGGGGGLFKGENGEVGSSAGDIFRINEQTLNTNVTIDADENASCTGPLAIASGVTLTVTSGGNLSIV